MPIERDLIYFSKRQGTPADPFVDITETLFVQYSKAFLKEVPAGSFKVTVKNSDNSFMTEVYTDNDLAASANNFYVNYQTGVLHFNNAANGQQKTCAYRGEGVVLYPASRIYTNSGNGSNIIESLQELVGLAKNIQPMGTYNPATAYKKGNIVFLNDKSYMCLQNLTGIAPPNVAYWQQILQGGLQGEPGIPGVRGEKGEKGDPGNAGETLYTWIRYANTPTTGMADTPDGKDYIGIAVNKTSPTKSGFYTDYAWSYIRGLQGAPGGKGDPGTVISTWKGNFSPLTMYPVGSLVHYMGSVYIAYQPTTGNLPTNVNFWQVFVSHGGTVDGGTFI